MLQFLIALLLSLCLVHVCTQGAFIDIIHFIISDTFQTVPVHHLSSSSSSSSSSPSSSAEASLPSSFATTPSLPSSSSVTLSSSSQDCCSTSAPSMKRRRVSQADVESLNHNCLVKELEVSQLRLQVLKAKLNFYQKASEKLDSCDQCSLM